MGQRFTEEQLEQMIMQLEQGGLLQAPPSLGTGRYGENRQTGGRKSGGYPVFF